MKLVIEKMPNLESLYLKELRLLLSAEEMIAIKMPVMAEMAVDAELVQAFRRNVEDTHQQASRLREMLMRRAEGASPLKCKVVYALFDEMEDLSEDASHNPVRDAALIAEGQRIQHYQIAAYSALREFARILSYGEDVWLIEQTLGEEELANQQLSMVAERVYPSARMAA
jgi:ferritin-like metal-binding protein YciE